MGTDPNTKATVAEEKATTYLSFRAATRVARAAVRNKKLRKGVPRDFTRRFQSAAGRAKPVLRNV